MISLVLPEFPTPVSETSVSVTRDEVGSPFFVQYFRNLRGVPLPI